MRWLAIGFCLVLLASCSVRQPKVDQAQIAQSLKSEMPAKTSMRRISIPASLAVYFKPSVNPADGKQIWKWTSRDKQQILGTLERLKKLGVLSSYTALDDSSISDPKSLQQRTAATGAKLLLVLHGAGDVDAGRNKASRLYPFLITTLFVPGNETESVFIVGAALWDAAQSESYVAITAQGEKRATSPLWFSDKDEIVAEAREKAVRQLKSDLYRSFLDLAFGPESGNTGSSSGGQPVKGSFVPRSSP